MAIYSSMRGLAIPSKEIMVLGEISLTGDLRPVSHTDKMINEAKKMGFTSCIVSKRSKARIRADKNFKIVAVNSLDQALRIIES